MTDPASASKPNYKSTLNLPSTPFSMKANLVQNESTSQKRWANINLYEKMLAARSGAEPFVFHDGPPYANGSIHLGHLLNKCLKDFVVRSKFLSGRPCPYIPGWDCHGLPIEHKVQTAAIESGKMAKLDSLEPDARRAAIRRDCRTYAEKFIKLQTGQMQRLLTLADYDHPYLTMAPEYEAATLGVFAELVAHGLVYRKLKAVHWSIENRTALAEAELEYEDRDDPSVYVEFDAADTRAVEAAFDLDAGSLDRTPTFMIWTTTPWTIPANLLIAVHPEHAYALAEIDGTITIIAEALLEKVAKAAGAESVRTIAVTPGASLVGLRYHHPYHPDADAHLNNITSAMRDAPTAAAPGAIFRIVPAEYVTLDDGTGLVHTAPGHGHDDYQTGLRENIPVYCPVREDGTYDDTAPDFIRGMSIWDANPMIAANLRDTGRLFHQLMIRHSYPHDWRGRSPVIFRATEQWFVDVDKPFHAANDPEGLTPKSLRHRAENAVGFDTDNPQTKAQHNILEKVAIEEHEARERENTGEGRHVSVDEFLRNLSDVELNWLASDAINFIPDWGRNRMLGMLESRPDWCLSRQRAWGLPIPAFMTQTGEPLLTPASVRAVAKVVRENGSDCWLAMPPADLLAHYNPAADPDAPQNLDIAKLTKMHDIFDVWFESGSSWAAVMKQRGLAHTSGPPVDLYLEGSDQHRGWFQVSLLTCLGATGQPPYRNLLTHGFMVDKDGRKMSKSLGNTLNVDDLLKTFGADVARWWVATLNYESDIKVDLSYFETAGEAYRKIRNTLRFMLSNLSDYIPSPPGKDSSCGEGMCVDLGTLPPVSLDAWILVKFNALSDAVLSAYDRYDFRAASTALFNFCNDTLSAVYLAAVKDRLYCDAPDSPRRRRTQTALWELTDGLCRLLAPIIPHTADEAWRALRNATADDETVHLTTFLPNLPVTADDAWPDVLRVREQALAALERVRAAKGVENPLDAGVALPDPAGVLARFDPVDLADMLGVSRVVFDPGVTEPDVLDLRTEPRCERSWKRDGTVRERTGGAMLSDRDAAAVGLI